MKKTDWPAIYDRLEPTPDADVLCLFRACYSPGEDKGNFTPGRGYTSYHAEPRPVCMTRMCHGCPSGPVGADGVTMRPALADWHAAVDELWNRANEKGNARYKALANARRAMWLMANYLAAAAKGGA